MPSALIWGAVRNGRSVCFLSACAVISPMQTHTVPSGTDGSVRKKNSTPLALEKVR